MGTRCTYSTWLDYFLGLVEDDKGQLSTTRIILWGAFILSSIKFYQVEDMTWEMMGGYLTLWVVGYVGGKFADAKSAAVEKVDSDAK